MSALVRVGLFAIGCAMSGGAMAVFDQPSPRITMEPPQPAANEPIRFRLDLAAGCYRDLWDVAANVPLRTIRVEMETLDFVEPCRPDQATPQFRDLGPLPSGVYTAQLFLCGFPPPGVPPCELLETKQVVIGEGEPAPSPVPTHSSTALVSAAFALLSLGLIAMARERS